jgi:hypothetical protein
VATDLGQAANGQGIHHINPVDEVPILEGEGEGEKSQDEDAKPASVTILFREEHGRIPRILIWPQP